MCNGALHDHSLGPGRREGSHALDGYLNTYVTLRLQSQRWGSDGGNQLWHHEVYNAGCLAEAGVHYFQATGKTSLLAAAVRFANLLVDLTLGKERRNIVPTHALPEEAFLKLYRLLSDEPALAAQVAARPATDYFDLVRYWLDRRGRHDGRISFTEYAQDHVPLADQAEAVGHSVRALLCYTGLTAFCREAAAPEYEEAARRLWADVTGRKLHISGGVGPIRQFEGFSHGFHLPNDGYLETCAGIALAFWAHQMGLLYGKGEHADIVERVVYNIALGGVGLAGTSYAYRNPLQGDGELRRWEWHECPCCPPMLMKLMASLPGMAWSVADGRLMVNHYLAGEAVVPVDGHEVRLVQKTDYPWDGRITIEVQTGDRHEFELCCRIPGWCERWSASVNGEPVDRAAADGGYLRIRRQWRGGETVELDLTMEPVRMQANPSVQDDRGRVAVQRGPILYCFEAVDNAGLPEPAIGVHPRFTARREAGLLGDVVVVEAAAGDGSRLTAVPFYARGNRGDGPDEFEVWVTQEGAVPDNRDGAPTWLYRPYEPFR